MEKASYTLPEFIFNEFVEVEKVEVPSIIKDEGFRKSIVTASGEHRADLIQLQRRRDRRGSDSSAARTSPTSIGEILGDNEDYDDEVFISKSCESSATVISKKKATAKTYLDSASQDKEADFYTDECAVLTKRGEIKPLDALKARGTLRVKTSDHTGCSLLSKSQNSSKSTDSSSSSAYASAESLTPTNEAKSGSSSLGYDEFGCFADILDYKNHCSDSTITEKSVRLPDAMKDLQEDILNQNCEAEDYPLEYESEFRRQVIPEDDARTRAIAESNSRKRLDTIKDALKEQGEISSETFITVPDSQTVEDSKDLKKSSSKTSSYSKEKKRTSSSSSQEEFRIEKVVCDWVVPLSKKEKAEKRQNQVETFKSNTKNQFNLDRKKFVPSGLADYHDKKEYYGKFGSQDDEIASILFRDEVKSTKRKAKEVTKELKNVLRSLRLSDSPNTPTKVAKMAVSQSNSHPSIGKQSTATLRLKSSASFSVTPTVSSVLARKQQDPIPPIAPCKILEEEIAISCSPKSKHSPRIHSQGSKESLISDSSSIETLVSDSASCLADSSKKSYSAADLEKEAVEGSPVDPMNLSLPDIEEMLKSENITFSSLASAYCSKVKGFDLSRFTEDLIQRDAENPPGIFAFLPSVDPCKENLGQEQHNDKLLSDSVKVTSPLKTELQEAPKPTRVRSSPQPPSLVSSRRPSPPFSKQLMNRILASLPLNQPMKRKRSSQGSVPTIVVTPPSPCPKSITQSQLQATKYSEQTFGSIDTFAASAPGSSHPAERYSQQTLQSNFTFTSDSMPQCVPGTHSSATSCESGRKLYFRHTATSVSTPPSAHEVTTQTSQFGGMISVAIVPPTPPSEVTTFISSMIPEKSDSSHLTVPPVDLSECAPPTFKTPGSPLDFGPISIAIVPPTPPSETTSISSMITEASDSNHLTVPPVDLSECAPPTFKTPGSPQLKGMVSVVVVPPKSPTGEATSISGMIPEKCDSTHLTVPHVDLSECAPPVIKTPGSPIEFTSGRVSPRFHKIKKRSFSMPSRLTVPPEDAKEEGTPTFWTPGTPPPKTRPFTHPPAKFDGSKMEFTFTSTNLGQETLPTVIVTPPTPRRRKELKFMCPLPVLVELEEGNTTSEDTITARPNLLPSHEREDDDDDDDDDEVATISVGCITPPSIFREDCSPSKNLEVSNSDADNIAMPSRDIRKSGKTAHPSSPCEDNKHVSRLSLSSVDLRSLKSASVHSSVTSYSLTNVPTPQILARWKHGIIPAIVMTPPTPPNDSDKVPKEDSEAIKSGQQSSDCLKICTSDGKVTSEDALFLSKLHTPIQAAPDFSDTKVDTCLALASIPTPRPTDSLKGGSPNLTVFKFAPKSHIADVNRSLRAGCASRSPRKNSSQSAPFLKGLYGLPSLEIAYQASLENFEVDSLNSPLISSPRMRKVGPSPLVTYSARSPPTKNNGIFFRHIFSSKSTPSSITSPSVASPFKPSPHPALSKPTPAHCALSPHWDTDAMPAKLGTPHISTPRQVFHFEPAPADSAHVHSASVGSLSADNPTTCPIIILSNQRADSVSEEGSINSSGSSADSSSSSSEYSSSFHPGSRNGSSLGTLESHTPRGENKRRSSMSTGRSTSRKSVQFALSTKPGSDCSICKENSASSSLTQFEDLISPSSAGSSYSQNYNYRDFACSSDEICSTAAEKSPSFNETDRDYKLAKRLQAYELLSSSAESIQSSENSIDPAVLSEVVHFTSPGTMKRPIAPSSVRIEFQDSVPSLRSSLFAGKRKIDENGEFNRAVMVLKSQADYSPKEGSISPGNVVCAQSPSCGAADGETDLSSIRDIVHQTKDIGVDSSVNSDDEDQYLDLMSENSYRSDSVHTNSSEEAASVEPYILKGKDSAYDSVHSTKAESIRSEGTGSGPSVESYLRPLEAQYAGARKCESTTSRSAPSVLSSSNQSNSSLSGSSSIEKIGDIIVKFSKKCEKANSAPSIRSVLSSAQHQPTSQRRRPSVYFRPSVKLENAIATAVDLKHGLEATIAILSSTNRGNTPRRRFSVTAIDSPLVCHPPPPTPVSSEKDLMSPKITINEEELQEYRDIDNAHKKYLKMLSTATPLMQRILTTSGWPAVAFLLEEPIEPYSAEPPEWFQAIQRQGDPSAPQLGSPTKKSRSNTVTEGTETNEADIITPEITTDDSSKLSLATKSVGAACENNLEDTGESNHRDTGENNHEDTGESNHKDTDDKDAGENNHEDADKRNHDAGERNRDADERNRDAGESNRKDAGESNHKNTGERTHDAGESNRKDAGERNHKNTGERTRDAGERNHKNTGKRNYDAGENNRKDAGEKNHKDAGESNRRDTGEKNHKHAGENIREDAGESYHKSISESKDKDTGKSDHKGASESKDADESDAGGKNHGNACKNSLNDASETNHKDSGVNICEDACDSTACKNTLKDVIVEDGSKGNRELASDDQYANESDIYATYTGTVPKASWSEIGASSVITEASGVETLTDIANDSMTSTPSVTVSEKSEGVKSSSDIANEGPESVASMRVGSELKIQLMKVTEACFHATKAAAKRFENGLTISTSNVSAIHAGSKSPSDIANDGLESAKSNAPKLVFKRKTLLPSTATEVIEKPTSSVVQQAQENSSGFCKTGEKAQENLYPSFPATGPEIREPIAGHGANQHQPEPQAAGFQGIQPNAFFAPQVQGPASYASNGAYTEWAGYPCVYPADGQIMYTPVQGYQPTTQAAPTPYQPNTQAAPTPFQSTTQPAPTPYQPTTQGASTPYQPTIQAASTPTTNENMYGHAFYDAGGNPQAYQTAPQSQNEGHGIYSAAGYQPAYQTGQASHQAQDEHNFYNAAVNQPTYQPTGEDETYEFFNSNAANNSQFQSTHQTLPKCQDNSASLHNAVVGYQPISHAVTKSQDDSSDGRHFNNAVEYQSPQNKNDDSISTMGYHKTAPKSQAKNADSKDLYNAVGPKYQNKNADNKDLYNAMGYQSPHRAAPKCQNENAADENLYNTVGYKSTHKAAQLENTDSNDLYNAVGNRLYNQKIPTGQGESGMGRAPLVDYEDIPSPVSSPVVDHKKPAVSPRKQRGVLSPPPMKKMKTRKSLSQRAKSMRSRLVDYSDTSVSTQSAASKADLIHSRVKPNAKKNRGKSALEILSAQYSRRSSESEVRAPLVADYYSGSQASFEQELVQQRSISDRKLKDSRANYYSGSQASSEQELVQQRSISYRKLKDSYYSVSQASSEQELVQQRSISDKKLNDFRANSQEDVRVSFSKTERLKEESPVGSPASVKSYLATNNTSNTQLLSDNDVFENASESMAEIISVTDNFLSYMSSLGMTSSDDGGTKPHDEDIVTESEPAASSSNQESETTFHSHETHSSYFSSGLCRVSHSIPTEKPGSINILLCQGRETTFESRDADKSGPVDLSNITSSESKERTEIQAPIESTDLEKPHKQKPKLDLVLEETEKVQEILPSFGAKEISGNMPQKQVLAPAEIEGVDESKPLQLILITPAKKDGISSKRHNYVIPPKLKLPPVESKTSQQKATPEPKKEATKNPRVSLMPQLSTVTEVESEVKSADGTSTPVSFLSEDGSMTVSLGSPSNVSPKKQQHKKKRKHRIKRFLNSLF